MSGSDFQLALFARNFDLMLHEMVGYTETASLTISVISIHGVKLALLYKCGAPMRVMRTVRRTSRVPCWMAERS